jgi:CDP-paratose 2-epimerase
MKLLVTGICGFVGSTLAKTWIEAEPGLTIYGMDNFIRPGNDLNRGELRKLGINRMTTISL